MAHLDSATVSHAGTAKRLNDHCFLNGSYVPDSFSIQSEGRVSIENSWESTTTRQTACLAVFDGVSGPGSGETAACLAAAVLKSEVGRLMALPLTYLEALMQRYAARVSSRLSQAVEINPEMAGAGASCACLCLRGEEVVAFTLGNCQSFLVRQNNIRRLAWISEANNSRSSGPSRFLGQPAGLDPAAFESSGIFPLEDQDILLLCTHSLTDTVGESAIKSILGSSTPQNAADELMQVALAQGCRENITLSVIRWSSADQPAQPKTVVADVRRTPHPRDESQKNYNLPEIEPVEKPKPVVPKMSFVHIWETIPIWMNILGLIGLLAVLGLIIWLMSGRN